MSEPTIISTMTESETIPIRKE